MTTRTRRKCRHCGQLFRPDPRNLRHQRYCSAKECRRVSKAASQRRWLAKAENRDYFRGPEHVARVRAWRTAHPGYAREKSSRRRALQEHSSAQPVDINEQSDVLSVPALGPIKMRQFIFTHTSGPVPRHAVLGVGGCPITRGRGSARGLVQCRRGRTAEQREPVVDPLSGQALVRTGPLVPSPAPRAQIEPGTEQVEKALSGALVDVEIGA